MQRIANITGAVDGVVSRAISKQRGKRTITVEDQEDVRRRLTGDSEIRVSGSDHQPVAFAKNSKPRKFEMLTRDAIGINSPTNDMPEPVPAEMSEDNEANY